MQWILLRQEVKWQNKSRNGQNYISPDITLQKMHLCAFLAWVAHFHISGHPSMNLRVENDLLIEEDPQDLREQWSILKNFILKIATTLTVKFISVSVLSTTFSLIWVLSTLVLSINFLTKPKTQNLNFKFVLKFVLLTILYIKGVIQQLRGRNFTQFWSLKRTKMNTLHNIYPLSRDALVDFLLTPTTLFLSTYLLNDHKEDQQRHILCKLYRLLFQ